jgi:type II secretion system protein H
MARTGRQEAFTLLEMLVVVFLIGLMSYVFAPQLGPAFSSGLDNSADTLEAELRYASERAVATGELHRLLFDLEEQRFRLEHEIDVAADRAGTAAADAPRSVFGLDLKPPLPQRELQPVQDLKGEWRRFEDAREVLIERVRVGDEEFERDVVGIAFASDGSADAASVVLADARGERRILQVLPFTSEVTLSIESADD